MNDMARMMAVGLLLASLAACPPTTVSTREEAAITPVTKEVRAPSGQIVARMQVRDGVLDGPCEWFDGHGREVARGTFSHGAPRDGTFLDWSRYQPDLKDPWTVAQHSKDWITLFEAGYLSQSPDYQLVRVAYQAGVRLEPRPSP
jgi:hypothetical protein